MSKTTDFKELMSLYFDKVADTEYFDDVEKLDKKVYQELTSKLSDFHKEDDILRLLTSAEEAFAQQGFIRGYQLATRIYAEAIQNTTEGKECVCI